MKTKIITLFSFIELVFSGTASAATITTRYVIDVFGNPTLTQNAREVETKVAQFDPALGTLHTVSLVSSFPHVTFAAANYTYGNAIGGGVIGSWSWQAAGGVFFEMPGMQYTTGREFSVGSQTVSSIGPVQLRFNTGLLSAGSTRVLSTTTDIEPYIGSGDLIANSGVFVTEDVVAQVTANSAGFFFLPTNRVVEAVAIYTNGINTLDVIYNFTPIPEISATSGILCIFALLALRRYRMD